MCANAKCRGLNQQARLAAVCAHGVDQGLNARANPLRNETDEKQKELRLREEGEADHDDRQEERVDEEHAVGADEPHPEDAAEHDDHPEGELAENHLDADRRSRAGGLAGVLGDVVDAPAAKAGEPTRREGPPEAGDHDGAAEESPFRENSLADEQALPAHRAERDGDELHQHGGGDPAPPQVAQVSEKLLRTVPAKHLLKDEHQHADGEHQLQNEEGDSFWICAHVPCGLG